MPVSDSSSDGAQAAPIKLLLTSDQDSESMTVEVYANSAAELIKVARRHGAEFFGANRLTWDQLTLQFVDPTTGESRSLVHSTPMTQVRAAGLVWAATTYRKKQYNKQRPWGKSLQDDAEAGMSMVAYDAAEDAFDSAAMGRHASRPPDVNGTTASSVSLSGIGKFSGSAPRYKGHVDANDPTLDFEMG